MRVEQCQFADLAITANTQHGIQVGIVSHKAGARTVRSVQRDTILLYEI